MDTTICIRASEPLKTSLLERAELHDTTLSKYSRNVLMRHIDDQNNIDSSYVDEDEDYYEETFEDHESSYVTPYEKTYAFTCLLAWLFCRQMHPQDNNSIAALNSIKLKVEKVLAESSFSNELKLEFLKVLGDLNRYLLEPDYEGKSFEFPLLGHHLTFNYYLLMNEIWSLEIPMP
jgi:hypothetical protein